MKYIILGYENSDIDSLISGYLLEKILKIFKFNAKFVVTDSFISKDCCMLCQKYGLDIESYINELNYEEGDRFILVDHHERDVPGEIFAVIDHHPVIDGNKKREKMHYYVNENACSTTCLLIRKYEEILNEKDLELGCLAAFVDTVSFHSSKTNKNDVKFIKDICKKYNFDYDKLYQDGLCLTDIRNIEEACFNELKKYTIMNYKIYASLIRVDNFKSKEKIVNKMIKIFKKYLENNSLFMFVFIVYDMSSFKTVVYKIMKDEVSIINYGYYASRGNKIIFDIKNSLEKFML